MAAEITPAPTEEEAAAIMAAVEHLWPKPVLLFTAEQAKEYGLVDHVVTSTRDR